MFCSNCGESVPKGKAFCKYCGTPTAAARATEGAGEQAAVTMVRPPAPTEAPTEVNGPGWDETATVVTPDAAEAETSVQAPDWSAAETAVAPDAAEAATAVAAAALGADLGAEPSAVLPAIAELRQIVPPPVTGVAAVAATPPARPPATPSAPYAPPYMQAPPLAPPPPPLQPPSEPRRRGRGGLIAGIIIAILVLAGAAAAATIMLIDDNGGSGPDTTAVQVTTTIPPATTLAPTTTTLAPTTTVSESTTTSLPTETSVGPAKYIAATAAVAALLAKDDARIPVLAKQINNTAPNVPQAVHDELVVMLDQLNAAVIEMSGLAVPPAHAESDGFLQEAAGFMTQRIRATFLGIEAMYDTGTVSSATKHFKDGQIARDNFRAAFKKFQNTRPTL